MQNQATSKARQHARDLRKGMTDSERRLWSHLRRSQLGYKFRAQHPIGPFVADFACLDPQLIIELDGSQHDGQGEYDEARDAFLRSRGFKVLRFATHEPLRNIEGVLLVIAATLESLVAGRPPPQPSPRGGGAEQHSLPREKGEG